MELSIGPEKEACVFFGGGPPHDTFWGFYRFVGPSHDPPMISYPFLGIYMRFSEVLGALEVARDHHIGSNKTCSVAFATTKALREPVRSHPVVPRWQPWVRTCSTLILRAHTPRHYRPSATMKRGPIRFFFNGAQCVSAQGGSRRGTNGVPYILYAICI